LSREETRVWTIPVSDHSKAAGKEVLYDVVTAMFHLRAAAPFKTLMADSRGKTASKKVDPPKHRDLPVCSIVSMPSTYHKESGWWPAGLSGWCAPHLSRRSFVFLSTTLSFLCLSEKGVFIADSGYLSFFLSWGLNTRLNHWTRRVVLGGAHSTNYVGSKKLSRTVSNLFLSFFLSCVANTQLNHWTTVLLGGTDGKV